MKQIDKWHHDINNTLWDLKLSDEKNEFLYIYVKIIIKKKIFKNNLNFIYLSLKMIKSSIYIIKI